MTSKRRLVTFALLMTFDEDGVVLSHCSLTTKVMPKLVLDAVAANAELLFLMSSVTSETRPLTRASGRVQKPTIFASAWGFKDLDLCLLIWSVCLVRILDDHRLVKTEAVLPRIAFLLLLCVSFGSSAYALERSHRRQEPQSLEEKHT